MTRRHDDDMPSDEDRYFPRHLSPGLEKAGHKGIPCVTREDGEIIGGRVDSAKTNLKSLDRLAYGVQSTIYHIMNGNPRSTSAAMDILGLVRPIKEGDEQEIALYAMATLYHVLDISYKRLSSDDDKGLASLKSLQEIRDFMSDYFGSAAQTAVETIEAFQKKYESALRKETAPLDRASLGNIENRDPGKIGSLEELSKEIAAHPFIGHHEGTRYLEIIHDVETLLRDLSTELTEYRAQKKQLEPKAKEPVSTGDYFIPQEIRRRTDARSNSVPDPRRHTDAVFASINGKVDVDLASLLGIEPYQERWPSRDTVSKAPAISRVIRARTIDDWLNRKNYGPQFEGDSE